MRNDFGLVTIVVILGNKDNTSGERIKIKLSDNFFRFLF